LVARNPTHALGNIIEESGPRLGRHSKAPLDNARPRVLGEVGRQIHGSITAEVGVLFVRIGRVFCPF
jgi:hypothetical protein